MALRVNDAGARAAAAFVVLHGQYFLFWLSSSLNFGCFVVMGLELWDLGDARALPPFREAAAVPVDRFKQIW